MSKPVNLALVLALSTLGFSACGGDSAECKSWSDCGVTAGDALCLGGNCSDLSADTTGDIAMSVSIGVRSPIRGQVESIDVLLFVPENADGSSLTCEDLTGGANVDAARYNRIRDLPINLSMTTGTLFQGISVQAVPSRNDILVLVRGFSGIDQAGDPIGLGCQSPVRVPAMGSVDVTVMLEAVE